MSQLSFANISWKTQVIVLLALVGILPLQSAQGWATREALSMSEAVGLIVAAIIAGAVAFFSLIITKEQSVSEFRQQWIDELRNDIAIIVGLVYRIHGESISKDQDDPKILWGRLKRYFTRFNRVIARIRLRLNPHEDRKEEKQATKDVLKALDELEAIFGSEEPQYDRLPRLSKKLVTDAQVILKQNWNRVRAGEPIYQGTKWMGLALAVGAGIYELYKMTCC